MYFIKTAASITVGEFVQFRDQDFALVEYVKLAILPKFIEKIIQRHGLNYSAQQLLEIIQNAQFNHLYKL